MGLSHVAAFDHVLGANPVNRPGFKTLYTHESLFHEPLTLFAYLAGVTTTLQFATCIMVLPQRQTALVAKQAAEVDVLSGGRLRLGVGVGWNAVEYEGLGQDFSTRGARCGEQIQLLRELWTKPCVTFEGRWDTVRDAGINPLPVQRPIPIWLGGMADAVIERVGTLADGWFPRFPSMRQRADADILPRQSASPGAIVERMRHIARSAGRDPCVDRHRGAGIHSGPYAGAMADGVGGMAAAGGDPYATLYNGCRARRRWAYRGLSAVLHGSHRCVNSARAA